MGLSVIANIASTGTATPPGVATEATLGIPGDFAALLSAQTLATMLPQASNLETAKTDIANSVRPDKSAEVSDTEEATPLDPSILVAWMGNPQIQPPPRAQANTDIPPSRTKDDLPLDVSKGTGRSSDGISNTLSTPNTRPVDHETLPTGIASTVKNAATDASTPETANIAAPAELPGNSPSFSASLAAVVHHQDAAPAQPTHVSTTLHSAAWPEQFGEKIVWMAKNDQQTAQISINPPQLGPVQVTLSINGEQASAVFASPHAEVRQAIENSMPQLRDMLASAGISLGDANVGANLAQQNQNNAFQTPNRAQSSVENAILPANDNAPVAGIAAPLHHGRGLVDLFA